MDAVFLEQYVDQSNLLSHPCMEPQDASTPHFQTETQTLPNQNGVSTERPGQAAQGEDPPPAPVGTVTWNEVLGQAHLQLSQDIRVIVHDILAIRDDLHGMRERQDRQGQLLINMSTMLREVEGRALYAPVVPDSPERDEPNVDASRTMSGERDDQEREPPADRQDPASDHPMVDADTGPAPQVQSPGQVPVAQVCALIRASDGTGTELIDIPAEIMPELKRQIMECCGGKLCTTEGIEILQSAPKPAHVCDWSKLTRKKNEAGKDRIACPECECQSRFCIRGEKGTGSFIVPREPAGKRARGLTITDLAFWIKEDGEE